MFSKHDKAWQSGQLICFNNKKHSLYSLCSCTIWKLIHQKSFFKTVLLYKFNNYDIAVKNMMIFNLNTHLSQLEWWTHFWAFLSIFAIFWLVIVSIWLRTKILGCGFIPLTMSSIFQTWITKKSTSHPQSGK